MFRPVPKFRVLAALVAVAALSVGALAGVAAAEQQTTITFKRWSVLVGNSERNVPVGETVERCSDEKITSIAASGTIRHARENAGTTERWYRDGKLYHAFRHLFWNESGSGTYTTYGLGSDKGLKDGTWKVVKSEAGRVLDSAMVKLKTKPNC